MRSSLVRRIVPSWLALALVWLVAAAQPVWSQTLTSDKEDYQPGETAVLTGSGFAPNEMVTMLVMHIDGSLSLGPAHDPWYVDADVNGNFMALWECLEDCRGATLLATADQASGAHAEVEYTDALGIGRVTSVVPLDGGCVDTSVPCTPCGVTSGTGAVQSWYVQQGKTYAVTLSCVTNCASAGTAPTLQVLVTNPEAANPASQCLTATKVATGVYTFSITIPNEACYTFPILYCTTGCSPTTGFNARRCDGRNFQAQLKAGHFLPGCVPVAEPRYADECCTTPNIVGVPPDATVECDAVPAPATVNGIQPCSYCGDLSVELAEVSTQGAAGTCAFSNYTITRTWTATDGCGIRVTRTQVITVQDTTPPSIYAPGPNMTLECPASPSFTAPSVSDNCGDAALVLVNDDTTPGCGGSYVRTKTWKAVDICGNQSGLVSQTIAVLDTQPPSIGAPGPNQTLECPATPVFTEPSVSDACSTASLVLVSDVTTPGCGGGYSRTKTWKAVDACGHESPTVSQTIAVFDNTPPSIGLPGPNGTVECPGSPSFTAPSANDTCSGASIVIVSDVTTPGCGGTYSRTITWKAVDGCGNQSGTVSQTIAVIDTTPPSIGAPGPNATLECPASPSFTAPTASDACGDATVVLVSDVTTPGCGGTYVQTKTWKAVDACGNQSGTVSQTVSVVDTTPPTIGPAGPNLTIECSVTPHFTVPTVTDPCGFAFAQQVSDVTTFGCGASYDETKTWKAVDPCGNESGTVSQTIHVVDTQPPVLTACAPNKVVTADGNCCVVVNDLSRPVATDACGIVVYQSVPREGDCFPLGDTTVQWVVRDACGNSVTCQQLVRTLGQITVSHYYDSNADGIRESGEPGIQGWKFSLDNGQVEYTDANGFAYFDVEVGTYIVLQETANEANWISTTQTSYVVTVDGSNCNPTKTFGSYCFTPPINGFTQSFWTSPQGAAVLQANDPAWRIALNALNLREVSGANLYLSPARDFTEALRAFTTWLNASNGMNMANLLSARLAIAKLDTLYMGLDDTLRIVVPGGVKTTAGMCIVPYLTTAQSIACSWPPLLTPTALPGSRACGCDANDAVVTIGDLLARADCVIGAYGLVVGPSTQKTYQECLTVLIDMVNNNGNNGYACGGIQQYINGGPGLCPATFP